MKNKFLLPVFMLLLTSITTLAQNKHETKVAAAVEQLRNAMISGNRTSLENIAADQLSYGHSGGGVENKAEFVEKIASGKSDFVSIELTEQTISVSGKTAVVRHILNASTNDDGKPGTVKLKVLLVWQKQNGKWKLLARQAVKLT
ncbi:MAG TPA: nuclear transport factor 2 family protein [Chitinophagaceae bacterium]